MKKVFFFVGYMLILSLGNLKSQTFADPNFSATAIASWNFPVGATFSKNGLQLFVWEQPGRVYVCNRDGSGNYIKQATAVLNITEEVGFWRDHGLLGFALDPEFASNGYIYLLYVVDRHHLMNFGTASYSATTNDYNKATIGRITRYQTGMVSGNLIANTGSRTILLGETPSTGVPILYESHSVGGLVFGADGMLLASTGDGASYNTADNGSISHTYFSQALADGIIRTNENVGSFRSQMVNSLNGKLLRIDPATGNGVASNPFYNPAEPRSPQSRVWAMGFRNPFRIAIRPGTGSTNPTTGDIGEVYVGDVGWNVREELNIVRAAGQNFGWPLFEGMTAQANYTGFAFNLQENKDEPNPLGPCASSTNYFAFKHLLKQATADEITTIYNPCNPTAAIGTKNRFYHRRPALDWSHSGNVTRVPKFNGNNASEPTIGTPESGVTGSAASFSGNCSVAGTWYNGTIYPALYQNTFFQGDLGGNWLKSIRIDYTDEVQQVNNFATGFNGLTCVAQNPLDGTLITVEVYNSMVKRINYGGNIPPVAVIASDKNYGPSALTVNFNGTGSYDPTVGGSIASYSWNFGDPASGASNTSTSNTPSHTFTTVGTAPAMYTVTLTVTDNGGASSAQTFIISVNNTPPVVNITSPIKNSKYKVAPDSVYLLTATVTDAEHSYGDLTYAWQTILKHNNHQHPEGIDTIRNSNSRISRIGCNGDTYHWRIELTVSDKAGLSTTDFTEIFPDCVGALPIFLHKFSVSEQGSVNFVKWSTDLEIGVEHFEVERSNDGIHFTTIHREQARNAGGTQDYSFGDNTFPSGDNYYRLKMVEHGAVIRYSVVIKISSDVVRNELTVVPNPVINNFSLSFHAKTNEAVEIQIHDLNGRLIKRLRESVSTGNNIIYIQNMPDWRPGMYLVSVQQGSEIMHGRFLKTDK